MVLSHFQWKESSKIDQVIIFNGLCGNRLNFVRKHFHLLFGRQLSGSHWSRISARRNVHCDVRVLGMLHYILQNNIQPKLKPIISASPVRISEKYLAGLLSKRWLAEHAQINKYFRWVLLHKECLPYRWWSYHCIPVALIYHWPEA